MKAALHSIKLFAVVLAALVLVLVVFGWRSSSQARAAMLESDAAFNAGEIRPATAHARRAATLYVPGAPHVDQAYARLFAIARGAEAASVNPSSPVRPGRPCVQPPWRHARSW